jgi:hypothetical protein
MIIFFILINSIYCFLTPHNILCPNKKTVDLLVYKICLYDRMCSEIYNLPFNIHLDSFKEVIEESLDFKNFNYIVKSIGLSYPLSISNSLINIDNKFFRTIIVNEVEIKNGLFYKIWTSQWRRSFTRINFLDLDLNHQNDLNSNYGNLIISQNYLSEFNSTNFYFENIINFFQNNNECIFVNEDNKTTFNTTEYLIKNFLSKNFSDFNINNFEKVQIDNDDITEKSSNIILTLTYILTTYKEKISMDETCNDINERLFFDHNSKEFKCVCLEGKNCDSESNDANTVMWIALMGVIVIAIVSGVLIFTSATIISKSKIKTS